MLVLTRLVGERVFIDTNAGLIEVTVVRGNRDRLRLAFNAPASMRILREEIAPADMRAKASTPYWIPDTHEVKPRSSA